MKGTFIKIVCCECGKHLGTKNGHGESGISHTFCPACAAAAIAALKINSI